MSQDTTVITITQDIPVVTVGIQGPPGPPGSDDEGRLVFESINDESFTIHAGQPVKLTAGGVRLAQADVYTNSAIGLAITTAAAGAAITVIKIGIFEQDTWINVIGAAGFTPNADIFLAQSVPGVPTETPPNTYPDVCQYIGKALTSTKLYIAVERPINL